MILRPHLRGSKFNVVCTITDFQCCLYLSISLQLVFWLPVYFFLNREDCWNVVRIWEKHHCGFKTKL